MSGVCAGTGAGLFAGSDFRACGVGASALSGVGSSPDICATELPSLTVSAGVDGTGDS